MSRFRTNHKALIFVINRSVSAIFCVVRLIGVCQIASVGSDADRPPRRRLATIDNTVCPS